MVDSGWRFVEEIAEKRRGEDCQLTVRELRYCSGDREVAVRLAKRDANKPVLLGDVVVVEDMVGKVMVEVAVV